VSLKTYTNLFALPSHLLRFDIILRAQTFNLVLDTGSSDLWFASSGCAGCSPNTPVLNPQSSSLQLGTQRISLDYGSGSASGVIARDTVTLGPFTVNPQTFGVYFPSPHFRFYLSLLLPRVCRVFYSLLARVTNAKLCSVRWHLMAISNGRRKVEPLISNQLRSKCAIDRPFCRFLCPVTRFPFCIANLCPVAVDDLSSGLIDGELSGIMGLAFVGIANSQALPFWQALVNNNQLTNPEFSFFITRFDNNPNAKTEEPGGVLTFGGTNSSLFQGDIDFQPFTFSGAGSFWLQTVSGAYAHVVESIII
jgi:hypothetical protein